jgi:hypothetical protein
MGRIVRSTVARQCMFTCTRGGVAVHVDAAISQEQDQAIPIFGDVFECRACWGFGRDLYRQSQIYARQGVDIDRSTLAFWVGKAAYELRPIHDALLAHLKTSSKLFMDETPALDPGRGKVKKGYLLGARPR